MVEGIACRSLDGLDEFSVAVSDKDPFVRGVAFSNQFFARFPGEVEECGALGSILGKGYVTGLGGIIPDNVVGFVHYG